MNDVIATHYCFGVNPCANQVHNQLLGRVRQSGKSEIVVSNGVIMLLVILPENFVGVRIQFDSEMAPAARLLRWDRPFPLGGPLAIPLPTGVFSCTPIHAPLPLNWCI
jgi:hypothetical protein